MEWIECIILANATNHSSAYSYLSPKTNNWQIERIFRLSHTLSFLLFPACLPAWGGFDNCRLFPIFPKVMEILTLTSGVWWQKVVAREDSQPSSFASLAKNVTPDCRRWPRMNFCVSRDPCICDEFNGAKFIYKQEPIEVFYYYVCNVPAVILLTPP